MIEAKMVNLIGYKLIDIESAAHMTTPALVSTKTCFHT